MVCFLHLSEKQQNMENLLFILNLEEKDTGRLIGRTVEAPNIVEMDKRIKKEYPDYTITGVTIKQLVTKTKKELYI